VVSSGDCMHTLAQAAGVVATATTVRASRSRVLHTYTPIAAGCSRGFHRHTGLLLVAYLQPVVLIVPASSLVFPSLLGSNSSAK
jgi:hypothetical protein